MAEMHGGEHVYANDVDIVIAEGKIETITSGYCGPCDEMFDCSNCLVFPGFINVHSHPILEGILNGLSMEAKSRQMNMTSLYEYIYLLGRPGSSLMEKERHAEARRAAMTVSMQEMLRSGTTTFVDFVIPWDGWSDVIAQSGMRSVLCASYRDAWWQTRNGYSVDYHWNEAEGERAFEAAVDACLGIRERKDPMIDAMLGPAQVDTVSAARLAATVSAAEKHDLRVHLHVSQSIIEEQEMFRRHGMGSIAWLESNGLLSKNTILAHALFVDSHSWRHNVDCRDIERIARSGAHVAHCPTQFARGGALLESFGSYLRNGINVAIGTDTYSHSMLRESQHALLLGKVSAQDVLGVSARDAFHQATVGGALALGRTDLGRLQEGNPADLVVADMCRSDMGFGRDPIKSLMFTAGEDAIKKVMVAGRVQFERSENPFASQVPEWEILADYQQSQLTDVGSRDWAGRDAEALYPLALAQLDSFCN